MSDYSQENSSRFVQDVEVVSQALLRRSGQEDPAIELEKLYQRFCSSAQEPVKLAVALQAYFSPDLPTTQFDAYERYLKMRIRPAIKALIDQEAVPKIAILEQKGWFGKAQLDDFIQTARTHKKTASLVWLMHRKDEQYGYEETDYSL